MKVKAGPLFKRITEAQDYHRIGKENWENVNTDTLIPPKLSKDLGIKYELIKTERFG